MVMLGIGLINWRQRPDMTIAVDLDVVLKSKAKKMNYTVSVFIEFILYT